jgi:hypothetical protein
MKANQMILDKLEELNRPTDKPQKKESTKTVHKEEEEDSTDEINNFPETSQSQSEGEIQNDMPNDVILLKTLINNELNDDIKMTIPRIQRTHYDKIKSGLKLVLDDIKNVFKRINENSITGKNQEEKEIIEMGFKYMTHKLRRHIAEKIGKDKSKIEDPLN